LQCGLSQHIFVPGIHILIWLLFFIITALIFKWNKTKHRPAPKFFLYTNVYHILLFYFNAYYVFPRLATRKRWPLYIPAVAALIAFSYYFEIFLLQLADSPFQLTELNHRIIFFPPIPFIIAGIILQVIQRRMLAEKMQKEQQAERLATELNFYAARSALIFYLNMMTIWFISKAKSDLLEPSLMKLSDLLRYMLYESGRRQIYRG